MGRQVLFDWVNVQNRASGFPAGAVSLSALSKVLILDALMVMTDRWRWLAMDDSEWDSADAAIALAVNEIMAGFPLVLPSFTDLFDRADGALGIDYAVSDFLNLGISPAEIVNERAMSGDGAEATIFYDVDEFGPDVSLEVEVFVGLAQTLFLYVRLVDPFTSGITGYRVMLDGFSTATIQRIENNTTNTTLASDTMPTLVTGDMIKVTAIDDEITVYLNDVILVQHTDTSPLDRAGYVGIVVTSDNYAIEEWTVQTL